MENRFNLITTGRSADRILVGAKLSAPVQIIHGAHPPSYTVDNLSFPGAQQPESVVNHPTHLIIIIIIIIFINCNWVITRWQWLFYVYTNIKKK
jgi:hypothetical protein